MAGSGYSTATARPDSDFQHGATALTGRSYPAAVRVYLVT